VVAAALLAIAGCGSSSSPTPSKHAVFVPPGLTTAPAQPSPAAPTKTSTGAAGTTGSGAAAGSAGTSSSAGTATTPRSVGSVHLSAAKITFAAPGGESAAAFASSADTICRSFRARARAIGAGATTLGTQETELEHLVSATEQSLNALTDLSPPASDEPGLRRFVTMTAAAVVAFAKAQSRTSSTSEAVGSQVEAQDLADSARSSRDTIAAAAAAHQLGLHVCGSPGAAWL
jgi:hypothetical protein